MAVRIAAVQAASPAAAAGVLPADLLVRVNGHEIEDVLDYRFYMLEGRLTLDLLRGGAAVTAVVQKQEYEDPGLEFDTYLMDRQQSCKNKCIFCFIDQLPKGLRKSLYFKDDDSRLSFLFGNYITLTNLSRHEIDRIKRMHISPVNISVHTTNPTLRVQMMKNPHAGEVLAVMEEFARADIKMNCQLVLCPGYNDGPELDRSLRDLAALYPAVQSIAAVPVGITRYRQGLTPLSPFSAAGAGAVIDRMEAFGNAFLADHGTRLCYPADEFYLTAGRPMPPEEFYEDYPQIENGVGMWTSFKTEFARALAQTPARPVKRQVSTITGMAARPLIEWAARAAMDRFAGLDCRVYPIENTFFGPHITVTGLLTGGDVLAQLRGKPLGDELLLPACTLRAQRDLFLDDMPLARLEEALGVPVRLTDGDGVSFLESLLDQEESV